ncbi:MAG: hypothetical protein F6K41_03205 [Symploca sp. SIO3E6]|nr:hypothetical protein [Caldora sp. SIO3E6]
MKALRNDCHPDNARWSKINDLYVEIQEIQVLPQPTSIHQNRLFDEPWWQLLQTVKENILNTDPTDERERRELLHEWSFTLKQVRELARKREFLLSETKQIIAAAQTEVEQKLRPQVTAESFDTDYNL